MTLRCPDNDRGPQPDAFPKGIPDIVGCGSTNVTGPDEEGLYDCGDCGMWFDPTGEVPPPDTKETSS